MSIAPIVQLLIAVGVATCGLALWKGGVAERIAACVIIVNLIIDPIAGAVLSPSAEEIFRLVSDGVSAMIMLGVTLKFGSPWLGAVMFFYAAQFALHSYYFVLERPKNDMFHVVTNNINFTGIILCLLIGTLIGWARRVRPTTTSG
jgi:hypothetical protein